MSKLRHRSANTAGTKPELDLMTPTEHKMLLEFMLYNMEFSMRDKIMVEHPRLYNVLYPGTLKVRVSIAAPAADGTDGRVICEE